MTYSPFLLHPVAAPQDPFAQAVFALNSSSPLVARSLRIIAPVQFLNKGNAPTHIMQVDTESWYKRLEKAHSIKDYHVPRNTPRVQRSLTSLSVGNSQATQRQENASLEGNPNPREIQIGRQGSRTPAPLSRPPPKHAHSALQSAGPPGGVPNR